MKLRAALGLGCDITILTKSRDKSLGVESRKKSVKSCSWMKLQHRDVSVVCTAVPWFALLTSDWAQEDWRSNVNYILTGPCNSLTLAQ